jgi:AcrR family transcriptional regulator
LPNLSLAPRQRRWTGLPAADRLAERRRLLLDAAFDLLGSEGWEAMTVRAVLERARLNPRYFYESFASIDQLVVAVYDRVVAEMGGAVWAGLAGVGEAPTDQVRAVVESIVAFIDGDRRRGKVLYVEGLGNEALNRRRAETGRTVVAFVVESTADRRPAVLAPDEVGRAAASILVGGFSQLLVDWLAGRVQMSRAQLIDDATALFVALGDAAGQLAASRVTVPRTGRSARPSRD